MIGLLRLVSIQTRVITILMLILICGLVVLFTRPQSRATTDIAYLFTDPDGKRCTVPCVLGVDPTTMSIAQGSQILNRSLKLVKSDHRFGTQYAYEDDRVQVSLYENLSPPNVSVHLKSDSLTFSELFMLWGMPQQIIVSKTKSGDRLICASVSFVIRDRAVWFKPEPDTETCMNPALKISGMTITVVDSSWTYLGTPWQGFQPDTFYYEAFLKKYESISTKVAPHP